MIGQPRGYYRRRCADGAEDVAWIQDGLVGLDVSESLYRANAYEPAWEDLPLKEEYDLAQEAERARDA